jgi:hypothetical protein
MRCQCLWRFLFVSSGTTFRVSYSSNNQTFRSSSSSDHNGNFHLFKDKATHCGKGATFYFRTWGRDFPTTQPQLRLEDILYFDDTIKSLGDKTFTVLKDQVEKTMICTSSSRLVRVKIPEQYKVEYGSAMPLLGLTSLRL